jgi:excisionase family DNA binding protein
MGRKVRSRSAKARPRRHVEPRPRATDNRLDRRVDPVWLTVSQLCRRWQLGRKTIYKFIDAEILPVWKVGPRLYRVAMRDVLRFEAQNKLPPK